MKRTSKELGTAGVKALDELTSAQTAKAVSWVVKSTKGWAIVPQNEKDEHIEWLTELMNNAIDKGQHFNTAKLFLMIHMLGYRADQ